MKKILLIFIIGIFLLSSISALDKDYIGKQYESMNLVETCVINGFACDNSFTCNITVINPDHDVVVLNQLMTRNDTIYNYTFSNTGVLGEYEARVYCTNVTLSGDNVDGKITITTTGKKSNIKMTIFLSLFAFFLFLLALYLKNNAIGFIAGIIFLITGMYLIIYGLGDIADLYTRSLGLAAISFGIFVSALAGVEWLEDLDS